MDFVKVKDIDKLTLSSKEELLDLVYDIFDDDVVDEDVKIITLPKFAKEFVQYAISEGFEIDKIITDFDRCLECDETEPYMEYIIVLTKDSKISCYRESYSTKLDGFVIIDGNIKACSALQYCTNNTINNDLERIIDRLSTDSLFMVFEIDDDCDDCDDYYCDDYYDYYDYDGEIKFINLYETDDKSTDDLEIELISKKIDDINGIINKYHDDLLSSITVSLGDINEKLLSKSEYSLGLDTDNNIFICKTKIFI